MPFGLCNALENFQICMMAIFTDVVEQFLEVFMDDFSIFGDSYENCLSNLTKVLKRCEETTLVRNWEKSHFMVREGIVLGHRISRRGIEVDKVKVDVIEKLPPPMTVKGVCCLLRNANFQPLCTLLEKDTTFKFNEECLKAFDELKKLLILAPIIITPN
ncbi:Retrovirus-related Pol polyprotein from transposon 17.6 [Gossypium australe]|uniref:Retrovirus-related Pol polyprotein from transposon 17.6 n=1 Tax=Gossypium australe TaxID=47621 RepID=A0A5B6V4T7_9ROSI|nr:Retrovirus-related Pol polyprotein from transposon 17.6 [Gossypium australe]